MTPEAKELSLGFTSVRMGDHSECGIRCAEQDQTYGFRDPTAMAEILPKTCLRELLLSVVQHLSGPKVSTRNDEVSPGPASDLIS